MDKQKEIINEINRLYRLLDTINNEYDDLVKDYNNLTEKQKAQLELLQHLRLQYCL